MLLNKDKESNKDILRSLKEKGYTDMGWANDGSDFTSNVDRTNREELTFSRYAYSGSHNVIIDHNLKEILHYDSSD